MSDERWIGLIRTWTDVVDGQVVGMGSDGLPLVECAQCHAMVPERSAEDHVRWHESLQYADA